MAIKTIHPYGIRHYILDVETELALLPNNDYVGSTAFVTATGKKYCINSSGVWVYMAGSSSEISGGPTADDDPIWDTLT